MIAFLNGDFLHEAEAKVSIYDRGFLYGDGLFETLRVCAGNPFQWEPHWQRLASGARFLKIELPSDSECARSSARELLERNHARDGILRINLSRGTGPRGYSPRNANEPAFAMTLHSAPQHPGSWKAATTTFRIRRYDGLHPFKTMNKLAHVLAKAEAEEQGADEALMLSDEGFIAQGASSNLFWVEGDTVCTAPLALGVLPGTTRLAAIDICRESKISFREESRRPDGLKGMFATLSSLGVVPISHVDGKLIEASPLVTQIRAALEKRVLRQ